MFPEVCYYCLLLYFLGHFNRVECKIHCISYDWPATSHFLYIFVKRGLIMIFKIISLWVRLVFLMIQVYVFGLDLWTRLDVYSYFCRFFFITCRISLDDIFVTHGLCVLIFYAFKDYQFGMFILVNCSYRWLLCIFFFIFFVLCCSFGAIFLYFHIMMYTLLEFFVCIV